MLKLTRGHSSFYQSSADLIDNLINSCKFKVLYLAQSSEDDINTLSNTAGWKTD